MEMKVTTTSSALQLIEVLRTNYYASYSEYENLCSFINTNLDNEVKNKLVEVLNQCNCCDRHKISRPLKYESWVETTFHNTQEYDCSCKCRHFSRWICRTCE